MYPCRASGRKSISVDISRKLLPHRTRLASLKIVHQSVVHLLLVHLLNQTHQSLSSQITARRHSNDVITSVINVVQEDVILSSGLYNLRILNSSKLSNLISITQKNSRVQLYVNLHRLIIINNQSIMIVTLMITRVIIDGSRERIVRAVRKIINHQNNDVIRIVLVISQDTIHMGNIRLVSVVRIS